LPSGPVCPGLVALIDNCDLASISVLFFSLAITFTSIAGVKKLIGIPTVVVFVLVKLTPLLKLYSGSIKFCGVAVKIISPEGFGLEPPAL
jgi:hypothetical protein